MKNFYRAGAGIIAVIALIFGLNLPSSAQSDADVPGTTSTEAKMTTSASGTFEIKLTPQATDSASENSNLGRMTIDKQFHGDLEATSKGQMLTATTAVKGSAGYVAIELVTGKLNGRSGTFVLQHSGTMSGGSQELTVTVVPDSGTGQLKGLEGEMTINIKEGKHFYEFEYTLTPTP